MPRGAYDRRLNFFCNDKRKCFAKKNRHCTILKSTYEGKECPFAKAKKEDKLSYYAMKKKAGD